MKKLLIFAVAGYALLLAVSFAVADAGAAKLAASKCSGCHSLERLCDRLGNRKPEVWAQTVERMRGNGAQLTDAEGRTVTDYISTARPGTKPLCQPQAK